MNYFTLSSYGSDAVVTWGEFEAVKGGTDLEYLLTLIFIVMPFPCKKNSYASWRYLIVTAVVQALSVTHQKNLSLPRRIGGVKV